MAVIALGADHAGFGMKESLQAWLIGQGHRVHDHGTHSDAAVDYPDLAAAVAEAVSSGLAERGILVCGTGLGMAMAANKVAGIRAGVCLDTATARLARAHNDANVLALGARLLSPPAAIEIVAAWLAAEFAGGRHARRLEKIAALERAGGPLPSIAIERSPSEPHGVAR